MKVTVEWAKNAYTAVADKDGKWKVSIQTPEAGGPYTIKISDGKELVLENVMIGELWFCSGQSNMEIPMKGYTGQSIENGNDDILHSTNKNLRLFTVKRGGTLRGAYRNAYHQLIRQSI